MTKSLAAHFDGKVIVPDEPVQLPVGQPLRVSVVLAEDSIAKNSGRTDGSTGLPEWCNVYEGLTDSQIAEIEEIIVQRADLTRPSE